MHRLVIVAIILETIVLSKMCLVLLVTAFKVDFQKNLEKNAVLLPPYYRHYYRVSTKKLFDLQAEIS